MKRQTILTVLVVLLVIGMLVAVADPVVASEQDSTVIVSSLILLPKLNSADTGD